MKATRLRGRVVAGAVLGVVLLAEGCGGTKHVAKTTTLAPPTTIPTTTTTLTKYTVKNGDTLSLIASRQGVPLAALIALNHITDPNKLTAGQVLVLPPTTTTTTTTTTSTTTAPTGTTAPSGTPGSPGPPPASSAQLTVSPASGRAGTTFTLKVMGAKANEQVTFEIDAPDGKKFTGPPHTVAGDGSVTASYFTQQVDAPGNYNVLASGNQGTSARATFHVDPPNPAP